CQIAERRRQAIAAMLLWYATQCPQGILQTLGKRDKALAAEHDVGILEAREGKSEVIKPMVEGQARDRDPEAARIGEVGETKTSRLVLLAEDHVLFGPMQRPPRGDPPLQRTADVG